MKALTILLLLSTPALADPLPQMLSAPEIVEGWVSGNGAKSYTKSRYARPSGRSPSGYGGSCYGVGC